MARKIHEVLAQRTDLATFLIHLTRSQVEGLSARDCLKSIVAAKQIDARNPMGIALGRLENDAAGKDSQKVVCFTESPLEAIKLIAQPIDGRSQQFEGYGIAIPRRGARHRNVNPVWYVDNHEYVGHSRKWLTMPIDALVQQAISAGNFASQPIAKLTPFIETMGKHKNAANPKEFWWEREWRHVGTFGLPLRYLGLCPEEEILAFEKLTVDTYGYRCRFVDPKWSLDRIVGCLSDLDSADLDPW